MSWGGHIIPDRPRGQVLRDLRFRQDADDAYMFTANFRHWDGRVWQARITKIDNSEELPFRGDGCMLTLTSECCRTYQFLTEKLTAAKSAAIQFGNIPQTAYHRLTADAGGTSTHPRDNNVCVYELRIVRHVKVASGRDRTTVENKRGLGRLQASAVTLFPTSEELAAVLAEYMPSTAYSLLPANINTLQSATNVRSSALGSRLTAAGTRRANISSQDVDMVVEEVRTAGTAADVANGLRNGDFRPLGAGGNMRVVKLGELGEESLG